MYEQLKNAGENGSSQCMLEASTNKEVRISFVLPNCSQQDKPDRHDIPETTMTDAD